MTLNIKRTDRKWFLTPVKKNIYNYQMIEDGDRVAVGLSGGKDSSTLFYILSALQKQLPIKFDLVPITLTLGFDDMDITPLINFVSSLEEKLNIEPTLIAKIVFDIRQEKNPCALCANLRRGALYETAKKLNCNKVALGHHLDDAIETFFMNLIFNGQMGIFQPKSYLDRTDITLIRPLISLEESTIIKIVTTKNIPVVKNPCPANKKTKREEIKKLVSSLSEDYSDIRYKFLCAVQNVALENFWNKDQYTKPNIR
ncbi:MAG: adenine nucleotide alpha hydrolase [Desulfitibacter sp. BRH_c19]|nr:MAG: adenine nucleotide alpha hydrolase [Desulfitibacter sp. BRH_c19]